MAKISVCCAINEHGQKCNNQGVHKLTLTNRGGRAAYLCDDCLNRIKRYSLENLAKRGKSKVNGFTYSIELELYGECLCEYRGATPKGLIELMSKGFIQTSDCTVDIEMKSPIFFGLNSLIAICNKSINPLLKNHHLKIGRKAGTHLHVGHQEFINLPTMDMIKEHYLELFLPLENYLFENEESTKSFFGRSFCDYVEPLNEFYANKHEAFINLEHDNTIEFRMPKFRNAEQYTEVVRWAKDVTNCVINNYIKNYSEDEQRNKHKAKLAGEKIVKLTAKYFSKFNEYSL